MTFREERDWYRGAYETVLLLVEQLNECLIVYSGEFPDDKLSPHALADIKERIEKSKPLIEKMDEYTHSKPYTQPITEAGRALQNAPQEQDIKAWLKDLLD